MPYHAEIVDVEGDGDCFYRAVYGFAMYHGFLDKLFECVNCQDITDESSRSSIRYSNRKNKNILRNKAEEDNWILCIRNCISEKIRKNAECMAIVQSTFLHWQSLDKHTYKMFLGSSIPDWIKRKYPNIQSLRESSAERFIKFISRGIQKSGHWASQIDFDLLNHLLKPCNIDIQVISMENALQVASQYTDMTKKHGIITSQGNATHESSMLPLQQTKVSKSTQTQLLNPLMSSSTLSPRKETPVPDKIITDTEKTRKKRANASMQVGGEAYTIYLYNDGDVHFNFFIFVGTSGGGVSHPKKLIQNNKIFIYGRIRRKYHDKNKKMFYVKIQGKKKYL